MNNCKVIGELLKVESRRLMDKVSFNVSWYDIFSDTQALMNASNFPTNEHVRLGILFGYIHQRTDGSGMSSNNRYQFTYLVIDELLLTPQTDIISVCIQAQHQDFLIGWAKGKVLGNSRVSYKNKDDEDFDNLFD